MNRHFRMLWAPVLGALVVSGFGAQRMVFEAIRTIPHPGPVFTQGLVYTDGTLLESSGASGIHPVSALRRLDIQTGAVLARVPVAQGGVFAEGLARQGRELAQLTWRDGKIFFYDIETLAHRRTLALDGEGWGLAPWGNGYVMSDGSAWLSFRTADRFIETGRLKVNLEGDSLRDLNELEAGPGGLWANVWHQNFVVLIDMANGEVKAVVDGTPLTAPLRLPHREAVLNGLAWRPERDTWFVTGKDWPVIYEARVAPLPRGNR